MTGLAETPTCPSDCSTTKNVLFPKLNHILAPHVHNKIDWNKIKDDEIHLDPSNLPDLSIPAFDWLREYHRDEL